MVTSWGKQRGGFVSILAWYHLIVLKYHLFICDLHLQERGLRDRPCIQVWQPVAELSCMLHPVIFLPATKPMPFPLPAAFFQALGFHPHLGYHGDLFLQVAHLKNYFFLSLYAHFVHSSVSSTCRWLNSCWAAVSLSWLWSVEWVGPC